MDFEDAAQRLARDQKKIRGRKPVVVSEKAKRQAEFQRKQRAKLQAERERKRRLEEYQKKYMRGCDRALNVKSLSPVEGSDLLLTPTSIHGTGDKIALPPSVLESLTAEMGNSLGNPWTFRIGIPNPDYKFPSSPLIHTLKPPADDAEDHAMVDSDDEEEDEKTAYKDELLYKYIAYTHCTVVEFTQEEGNVGIPQHIASALLDPQNRQPSLAAKAIPTRRTKDPAKPSEDSSMDVSPTTEEDPTSATPGHVAYGAFDLPDLSLEITLVRLPKGRGCTLVPTKEAVEHGFHGLKDVKLVLEQSLIRTRATLSKGDIVSTWHRGVQFDLNVTKVLPSGFGAITCINTDIEVDIGEAKMEEKQPTARTPSSAPPAVESQGQRLGAGRTLGFSLPASQSSNIVDASKAGPVAPSPEVVLIAEPPQTQTENVLNAQIRFSGGSGKRRFDITKTSVQDLLNFASSLLSLDQSKFRLVTRFPRRVLSYETSSATLLQTGLQSGQELFLVEMI